MTRFPLDTTGAVATTTTAHAPTAAPGDGQRRLFRLVGPANLALYLVVGAVPSVLLPLQVEAITPADKARNLAVVTAVGAVAAMLAAPVAGLVSDRTRSRFGRRAPWIVGGTLTSGLGLVGMGFANTIVQLVVAWTVVQILLNFAIGPLTAILPDRVPSAVRGTFATLAGAGSMVGILGGQIIGAGLSDHIRAAYLVLPGLALVGVTLFVVLCPDRSSQDLARAPFSWRTFWQAFWVNPVQHPDFFWGFFARLLVLAGYFVIASYQLYVLQDYVHLSHDHAVSLVPVLGLVGLVGILTSMSVTGPLSDRVGRRKPFVVIASVVMGVGFIVPLVAPTVAGVVVYAFVVGLGFGCYQAVDAALMADLLPSESSHGKDLGVLNIAATLPQTIGPAVGGFVVVQLGYHGLFPVALVLALLGALAVLPIRSAR